jgi:cell division protein FtsZ
LLEGASVNGARGVIINVTGGSDLSLLEVSHASTIVQEAADDDANIIFGAVVDPALEGRIKITVIATGFDPAAATRVGPPAHTPVDLSQYADVARLRMDTVQPVEPDVDRAPPVTVVRRPLFDLPPGVAATGTDGAPLAPRPGEPGSGGIRAEGADADQSSGFDVPAFLRRQDG